MLTQEELKELIDYNPDSGIFTWKSRSSKNCKSNILDSWNSRYTNTIAGSKSLNKSSGKFYSNIYIFDKKYKAHRLAFLFMNGKFPEDQVDHEDGNGLNNKWSNLKESNSIDNSKNHRKRINNSSGYTGVCFRSDRNKYVAFINNLEGNKIHLGQFSNFHEALKIRKEAELEYNYHKNHGQSRPL
jgi:hypothetical protein